VHAMRRKYIRKAAEKRIIKTKKKKTKNNADKRKLRDKETGKK
jgi:hypothetical protein